MNKFRNHNVIAFLIVSFSIGLLIALQFRSFGLVKDRILRDRNPNIFREIQILKNVTEKLRKEKEDLRQKKSEFASRASQTEAFKKEREKYELLSGEIAVSGPGIKLILPQIVPVAWFIDLVNELTTTGAEAIAVNGVRIEHGQAGFRVIGENTILLQDRVLRAPFEISAIGDKKRLSGSLLQPGSTFRRLEASFKNIVVTLREVDSLIFAPTL